MKIGIDNPIERIANSDRSHRAGWAYLWADIMNSSIDVEAKVLHDDEDWSEYDKIILDYGMDTSFRFQSTGKMSLNLFGGATKKLFDRMDRIVEWRKQLDSVDIPNQPLGTLLLPRIGKSSTYEKITQEWCQALDDKLGYHNTTHYMDTYLPLLGGRATFGDSHSLAMRAPSSVCYRNDGMTLMGVIKKNKIDTFLAGGNRSEDVNRLTFSLGSIDIRHHVCRESDPDAHLAWLLNGYEETLKKVEGIDIEVSYAVPVEDESRKIPKTGWFKGEPFHGTREQRLDLTKRFNAGIEDMCVRNDWSVNALPHEWYDMDGKDFMNEFMERPGSVHLARRYYRWTSDYGRDTIIF